MKNKKKGDVIDTLFTIVEERKKTKKKVLILLFYLIKV